MLEMVRGCRVPRCDLLAEQGMQTEYGFCVNVNARNIKSLMCDFILAQKSPVFLILELPTNQHDEQALRQNDAEPMHRDVYYLDGLSSAEAVALLDEYGELLIHDGLSYFGFGAHDATAEIMLAKYNIVKLLTKDFKTYQDFFVKHNISLVENCLTAWDTFNHDVPGEATVVEVDGKTVYALPEVLKSRGLYFAERRVDD